MIRSQLLANPAIISLKEQYADKGIDFDPALDKAIAKATGMTSNEVILIEWVIEFLNEYLQDKPAKTKAGRVIRWMLGLFGKIGHF